MNDVVQRDQRLEENVTPNIIASSFQLAGGLGTDAGLISLVVRAQIVNTHVPPS